LVGNGIAKNEERGINLLKVSSDKGCVNALYELALCYEEGRGVKTNTKEAARMYRLGYEQGCLDAMQRLARCYDEGRGVEQNKGEAKRLYMEISKRVLEVSEGMEWEENGDIEWCFNGRDGRLIIKGRGPLEDYGDGRMTCQMTDYGLTNDKLSPWMLKYY